MTKTLNCKKSVFFLSTYLNNFHKLVVWIDEKMVQTKLMVYKIIINSVWLNLSFLDVKLIVFAHLKTDLTTIFAEKW